MTAAPHFERAPAGWGFRPGSLLALEPLSAEQLPDLPLLALVNPKQRKAVVAKALAELVPLQKITPGMVQARYGLASTAAGDALDMARMRRW